MSRAEWSRFMKLNEIKKFRMDTTLSQLVIVSLEICQKVTFIIFISFDLLFCR